MYRWRNNGGWNKSHKQVEKMPRVDSFELAQTDTWGGVMCGRKWLETYHDEEICEIFPPDRIKSVEIAISTKPNGYGGEQLFFLCPVCGERRRYLYLAGGLFLCRKCAQLNYRSQQETRSGAMYYYHKGMKLVDEHLDTWPRPDGFSFCDWVPDRPRYMHQTTYQRYLRRFLRYRKKHADRQLEDVLKLLKLFK